MNIGTRCGTTLFLASLLFVLAGCGSVGPLAEVRSTAGSAVTADPLTLRGSQFLAVSVANLEVSSDWYRTAFGLSTIMDNASPDSSVHTMVLGSRPLLVELNAHRSARALRDYAGRPTPTFLVHGFFKGGLVVANLDSAAAVLRVRGVSGLSTIHADTTSALRFMFVRDPDGNFLQLIERDWRP